MNEKKNLKTGKPHNPPAFPLPHGVLHECEGMTLRDYFAAKAMQGIIGLYDSSLSTKDVFATGNMAYKIADLMLIARQE